MLKTLWRRLIRFLIEFLIKPLIIVGFKIYYRKWDRPRPLPKCNSDLLLEPAHKLARKIRSKEITSLKLIELYIERVRQVQPLVNCVVEECFDEAIEEAKKVDEILCSETIPEKYSEENAPLLGIPFTVKESICVKGKSNTTGFVGRKHVRASVDADVVKYMREAGAILICLTNTSELCMWIESSNYLFGTTRNPYNLSRIVGGSSGGEACIVASAASVVGIGSDFGGSIRIPAFFNGVYGHKGSSHLISNDFQYPPAIGIQLNMLATGPICRYASDLKLMMKIMLGPKYAQFSSKFQSNVDLSRLKYYFVRDLQGNRFVSKQSKDTSDALRRVIKFTETNLNVEVTELKPRKLKLALPIWLSIMNNGEKVCTSLTELFTVDSKAIKPRLELLKCLLGLQNKHTLPVMALALKEQTPIPDPQKFIQIGDILRAELADILGDNGVLFFPGFPISAPYHNQPLLFNSLDFVYYAIINALGFPSTQCPLGLSADGLPTGVQVVSNHGNDHLTIKFAEYLEANMIGWTPPF